VEYSRTTKYAFSLRTLRLCGELFCSVIESTTKDSLPDKPSQSSFFSDQNISHTHFALLLLRSSLFLHAKFSIIEITVNTKYFDVVY